MSEPLTTDPERDDEHYASLTGIYVRSRSGVTGRWGSHDIAQLTKPSLQAWLRSRGGENQFAENVVLILLGHSRL
jgi:hypothetical protein